MTVLAVNTWSTNGHLIADVAKLGYLKETDVVLDPTFWKGIWWNEWKPTRLVTHDLRLDGVDFRKLPHADGEFDAVVFDPPYVSMGGRATTGIQPFYDRFGLTDCPRTPKLTQQLINDGLTEIYRVVKKKGYVLTKCSDYVSSGKLWNGTFLTQEHALKLGFKVVDKFEMVGRPRSQPQRTRADGKPVMQQHARCNSSTLLVFRK